MSYAEVFTAAHPKPVDFPQSEYEANVIEIDVAATEAGYRLAGYRLRRAVFTTKPQKGLDA